MDIRFGLHVRALRRARGFTQDRLSDLSGLSPDTIRRLERGHFSPTVKTLRKLCEGLGLRLSTLIETAELCDLELVDELTEVALTVPRSMRPLAVRLLRALVDDGARREANQTGKVD